MFVTPDALAQRIDAGLAPALAADPATHAEALALGREILEYGVSVLPRELYRGRSGAEIAALIAEDLEAVHWLEPKLLPHEVERTVTEPAKDDDDPDAAPVERTVVESIPPRVVELGTGWSVAAFVLARRRPDLAIDLVEPSRERQWWWNRLKNLHRTRNLRVTHTTAEEFAARHPRAFDAVLVKREAPGVAMDLAQPLVREGGRIVSFQTSDRTAELRKPKTTDDGLPVRIEESRSFASPAARGRTLLSLLVGATELDGSVPAA